ncbi:MAG: butyrate kinase [Synergistaceae bacterium]|jgi:butyrate kinase|nr:butyrate kinase [Synergistaceae bacterium]
MDFRVLVINPGAVSTKIAVFGGDASEWQKTVPHSVDDLAGYAALIDQVPYRKKLISDELASAGIDAVSFSAVVGRGGVLAPMQGGTYEVSEALLADARGFKYGEHASNLGPILAKDFADAAGCKAYITDPVSTDEWAPIARLSGLAGMDRVCHFHALNHKAVARAVAAKLGRKYEDVNFVIAHLGTGISVGAHVKGQVVDVFDAMNEGAMSVDRAGSVPALILVDECYSGKYSHKEMKRRLNGNGGIFSYLGTKDMREAERLVAEGDKAAVKVADAFAYQISKDIGSMAAVCRGEIDRIILTGGMARFKYLADSIISRVKFLAPVEVVPGEEEMGALAQGALRVLRGEEPARDYAGAAGNASCAG